MTDNELREIETTAMNIVYQISDILVPDGADGVKLRQANNDKMINFTAGLITALIKQHTDRARIDELGNVQLQHGHYVTQTFVDGEVITIEDRLNQLKESE